MEYAPNVRFCEVIIDGKYQGLYVMTETITNGDNCRVNISEPVDGTDKTGYVLRLDRGSHAQIRNIETFTNYTYRNLQKFDIEYPRSGKLTPELAKAIAQDFSDFEKSLYSYEGGALARRRVTPLVYSFNSLIRCKSCIIRKISR